MPKFLRKNMTVGLLTLEKNHHPSASEQSALIDNSDFKLSATRNMPSKGAWEKRPN